MNFVVLSPEIPVPANTGGRICVYERLRYLSESNNVYFFSVTDTIVGDSVKMALGAMCKEVHFYNRSSFIHRISSMLNLWKGPYACVSRTFYKMKKDIERCCHVNSIDYIIVEFPQMLGNISANLFTANNVILELHNIEYVTLKNLAESVSGYFKKTIYRIESNRLKKWEDSFYTQPISLFTFVSSEDKSFFESVYPHKNTYHSPIGANYSPIQSDISKGYNIMFFGKMAYPANAEAAKWFAEEVFPRVQENIADACFYIVGKDPQDYLYELPQNNDHVILTGTVENVKPYYEKTSVVVVPLFHGGGVKVKVLEAMGVGKLVVSTTKGIEGTAFESGVNLLCADNAKDMAQILIDILKHPQRYEKIRLQALDTIKKQYTWKAIVDRFIFYISAMSYDA